RKVALSGDSGNAQVGREVAETSSQHRQSRGPNGRRKARERHQCPDCDQVVNLVRVEVLVASCCTPLDVQKKIVSILQGMQRQVPDLDWNVLDITKEPELAVNYKAPMTPAIYID